MNTSLVGGRLRFEWLSFLSALGLMSRIPVSLFYRSSLKPEHHNRAQIWYPAVGLVLGLALGGLLAVLTTVFPNPWSPFLLSIILVVIWVIFTGGLHIDGLADTFDAWVGGMGDRQRTLDIMKDPACGPAGVTAIVLCLLLKCALIAQLIGSGLGPTLILVPILARCWLLPLLATMKYARAKPGNEQHSSPPKGMAAGIAKGFPRRAGITSFLAGQALALLVLAFYPKGLLILVAINLISAALFVLIMRLATERIGGYTGDVLGASIELQELAVLTTLACMVWFAVP